MPDFLLYLDTGAVTYQLFIEPKGEQLLERDSQKEKLLKKINPENIELIGEITDEKLQIVRDSDYILREEIAKHGLDKEIWQYFTVLPGIRSVGVMGDGRTYDYTIGIRAVTSIDGMTADFAKIDWDVLQAISVRIVNEVDHVNRVVYDITSKPPATIEWE